MNDWMDAQTRVDRAHIFSRQQQWKLAAEELQAAVAENPSNHLWFYNLGLARHMIGDYQGACEACETADQLKPGDVQTLNCLGVCYTRLGKYAQALNCFSQIEKIDPNYEPAYCNRIELYTEIGQHERAELMFYLARQITEDCPICYYNIAISHYLRENYKQSAACLQKALEIKKDFPDANTRLGDVYYAKKKYALAKEHYLKELEISGADFDLYVDLADVSHKLGEKENSAEYFNKSSKLAPDDASVFFNLAKLAGMQGDKVSAKKYYTKALMLDRNQPGVNLQLAKIMLAENASADVDNLLLSEVNLVTADFHCSKEVADIFIKQNKMEQAISVLRRLEAKFPEHDETFAKLAKCYEKAGNYRLAVKNARQFLKNSYDIEIMILTCASLYKQKKYNRAFFYLKRILDIEPNNQFTQKMTRKIKIAQIVSKVTRIFKFKRKKK